MHPALSARLPTMYLAGPIRDDHCDDISWREYVIAQLAGLAICLNPLGGKTYDSRTHAWMVSGRLNTTNSVVRHDAWCIDHSEIVLANLTALMAGYPGLGTLVELGRAWGRGKLIYLIIDPGYVGHENLRGDMLHPFLLDIAAARFPTEVQAVRFLRRHLQVLSGANPHFDGMNSDTLPEVA